MADMNGSGASRSLLAKIIDTFLLGYLSPVLIAASLIAGAAAIYLTPREEEPQIVVPMADVLVRAPGLPVGEVERQIATPVEKLLHQIPGVKHVYSLSRPGSAIITVRFEVGEDREASLVKIYNKIFSNTDIVPPGVESWVVKPVEVDDVPIVIVTLWSENPTRIDDYGLRRVAEEMEIALQAIPQTNRTTIVGGRPRVVRVALDPNALAARQTSALDVAWALGVSNARKPAAGFDRRDTHFTVDAGDFFASPDALRGAVVNVVDGIPVYLKDIATVVDGPAERTSYTWIGFGAGDQAGDQPNAARTGNATFYPAVNIAVAKQKGSNAVEVARRIEERVAALAPSLLPAGVHARITRNYGATANEKVNELLEALAVAILIVIALITYSLGWREGLIIAAAVPITFALTLFVSYWAGFTINRVTLFALILSLGLVVDDPIVDVENIHRHLRRPGRSALDAVREAVNEVRPPILLATLAVIASFLPMYLITGMMGPYMRPMAFNVPAAMLMSMVVAFTVTPWLSYHMLARRRGAEGARGHAPPSEAPIETTGLYRAYAATLGPLLASRRRAWVFLGLVAVLFLFAATLAALRAVPLKLLPFDNKNELQVIVNPPEGTTLERTDAITRRIAAALQGAPEVRDVETYAGLASPMDFNGLVRHYYLREGPNVGEVRVNLVDKRRRRAQSHEIALRLRNDLEAIARAEGVRIAIVEVPPGPPVFSTLTVEVYGETDAPYARIRAAARRVAARLAVEPGVSDIDTTVEDDSTRLLFVTDQEKAALSGIAVDDVARTVALAFAGLDATRLHVPGEVNPLPVRLRVPRAERSGSEQIAALTLKGRPGIARVRDEGGTRAAPIPVVRLGEIGALIRLPAEKAIYHKDLARVAYVYAEAVGRAPAAIAADIAADLVPDLIGSGAANDAAIDASGMRPVAARSYLSNGGGVGWSLPDGIRLSWLGEGELNITRDVFRDLGIAFAVALLGIYMILIYQTRSYAMPLVLMISIPLSLIGIMPGFWLLNLTTGGAVGGYPNPTFFTATAMIGMIALAGIAVRNAILLIEFLHAGLARGRSLREAILHAGAMRTRPILLTAGTAMLAAVPIVFDPVFSGLAWSLIFGLAVSTAFTLFVVPVTYDLVYRRKAGHGLPAGRPDGGEA